MTMNANEKNVGKKRAIVFSLDAVFAAILAGVMVMALAALYSYAPSTNALQEMALDELTAFDKSGVFKSLASCPGNGNTIIQTFLSQTVPAVNKYAFAFMNVTVYELASFNPKCTLSGSYGAWTDTRVSSRRLFYVMLNNNQEFGLAAITVGE